MPVPDTFRKGCLLAACIICGVTACATASAADDPPRGDFTAVWMDERIKAFGLAEAMRDDDRLALILLADPSSPYSVLADLQQVSPGGSPWAKALQRMNDEFDEPMSDIEAKRAVAWDLGLTNVLPTLSAGNEPIGMAGDTSVQANLIKAGVSVDIFQQALRLVGERHYATAAYYAVAVQILRDRISRFPEARRRASGLREMVAFRFLLADWARDIVSSDWLYLSNMLESEMSGWRAGRVSIYGHREIPAAYRVARVAAAYRQSSGYEGRPPCVATGRVDRDIAASHPGDADRELCLTDANDRVVYAWYRRILATQMEQDESHHGLWPADLAPVIMPVAYAPGAWEGAFDEGLFTRHTGHAETADRLLIEDATRDGIPDDDAAEVLSRHVAAHVCVRKSR